ncbi:MAG: TIGR04255 family protein [Pirellula sp.]
MGNFSIDLDEKFDSLSNAPIVEAVIQFNAPPSRPFDQEKLKTFLQTRFVGYKTHGQMQVEAGFENSSDGNVAMHHKAHWDGYRLRSEDGKYICQWKPSALVFSRLQPYHSWPEMLSAVTPFWTEYQEVGRPEIIEAIGVRYISQIPLKENEKLTRYVQKIHPPLIGLGLKADSFFHQDTIPLKGYPYEVRLIRAVQPAAEKTGSRKVLIVDIDVSTTRAVTFDQFNRALDEMRYIKNKVFFTYMKDAAERFK